MVEVVRWFVGLFAGAFGLVAVMMAWGVLNRGEAMNFGLWVLAAVVSLTTFGWAGRFGQED